jgi:hypothetical protein
VSLGIGEDFFGLEATELNLAASVDALAGGGVFLGLGGGGQLRLFHDRDVEVNVDAVQQRARNLGHIALDQGKRVRAPPHGIVEIRGTAEVPSASSRI